jgi:hypothetical protein
VSFAVRPRDAVIGQIEASPPTPGIDQRKWLSLIGSSRRLAPVPPRQGGNPFTGKGMELRAPATTANVMIDDTEVGVIYWAMDGSPILIVDAQEGWAESVASIAAALANTLGARFVPETEVD